VLQREQLPHISKMRRLRISGASLVTPELGEAELRAALDGLGIGDRFDAKAARDIYERIAGVIGSWYAEQEAKDTSPVAKALLTTGRNLLEASRLLNGRQTGLRMSVELHATAEAIRLLALDPTVGSAEGAQTLLSNFQEQCAKIGQTCMVAYAGLSEKGTQQGRPPLLWYDEFTGLLLDIAEKAPVKPSVGKDRETGERTGWLFEAAQALEPFLVPWMRSQSAEACGKRLERSMKRLREIKRQKPPRR
jgi:hypothetical protein